MDSFLRRVAEKRELEQEAEIVALDAAELAAPPCRVCGGTIHLSEDGFEQLTVCTACGGRKREKRLQEEEARRARGASRMAALLALAGIQTRGETRMAAIAPERQCTKCSKRLRSDNRGETCSNCKKGLAVVEGGGTTRAKPDVRKRFRIVADALGFEGDALIDAFCSGWLDRVRGSVQVLSDDQKEDVT